MGDEQKNRPFEEWREKNEGGLQSEKELERAIIARKECGMRGLSDPPPAPPPPRGQRKARSIQDLLTPKQSNSMLLTLYLAARGLPSAGSSLKVKVSPPEGSDFDVELGETGV